MKKLTSILAILLCFGASMRAQTLVGEIKDEIVGIIPGCFSSSGHPYLIYWVDNGDEDQYLSLYKSDFTTHLFDIHLDVPHQEHVIEPDYIDLDAFSDEIELIFTQNLFNDDDFIEYFTTTGEYVTHIDTLGSWYDEELDTTYYYVDEYTNYMSTAIHVKSTNGNIIWTYTAEEGNTCSLESIFKFDNNYYLIIHTRDVNKAGKNLLYLIKQGQGVTKVDGPLPLSVFPTLLRRNQQITVELGEGNNAKEITVVNSLGQVVKRVPVAHGQRTINIPASELGTGLNIVNTRTLKGQGSCKIIVQ